MQKPEKYALNHVYSEGLFPNELQGRQTPPFEYGIDYTITQPDSRDTSQQYKALMTDNVPDGATKYIHRGQSINEKIRLT